MCAINALVTGLTGGTYSVSVNNGSFNIPPHDFFDIDYVGATNNIDTIEYKKEGLTVATITLTYVGGVPGADDALVDTATITLA